MIITRFAPSPNGNLHIGNIRIAIYSWIFAKKYNGKFIIRIEDTNINISKKKFTKRIIKDIKWMGIKWNDKIVNQTNNIKKYNKIIDDLVASKLAYPCFCSAERLKKLKDYQILNKKKIHYDKFCIKKNYSFLDLKNKKHVIRFKNPTNSYTYFYDWIYGNLKFNNNELDDFIIKRENGLPTYNFCVAFDDSNMKVTHVIRGSDHISNTTKQINILNSIKQKIPEYIHIPIILNENKHKLSKKINSICIKDFRKEGILSKSIIHYLITEGNSNFEKINKHILKKEDIINNFEIKNINKSPIIFDKKKLLYINKIYFKEISNNKISKIFKKFLIINNFKNLNNISLDKAIFHLKERHSTFLDILEKNDFLFKKDNLNLNNYEKIDNIYINIINYIIISLKEIKNWNLESINNVINNKIKIYEKQKKYIIYNLLRTLLTKKQETPKISVIMYILGKNISIKRLENINFINKYFKIKNI